MPNLLAMKNGEVVVFVGDGSDLGKSEGRSGEAPVFEDLVCFDVGESGICARGAFDVSEPGLWLPVLLGLVAGDDDDGFFLAFDLVIIEAIDGGMDRTGLDLGLDCRKKSSTDRKKNYGVLKQRVVTRT